MLIEKSQIALAQLPIDGLKAHLKLGSAFDLDTLQDDILAGFLRAAIAAVENRIDKILLIRSFEWRPMGLASELIIPIAPMIAIERIETWGADGVATELASTRYSVIPVYYDHVLTASFGNLISGAAVHLRAGMVDQWDQLPADLAQAVMMLAAHYYEFRNDTGLGEGCMPFGVHSLLQRHRNVRVTFGRGAQ